MMMRTRRKIEDKKVSKINLEPRFLNGVFLGLSDTSDEFVVWEPNEGIRKARTIRRRPEEEMFDREGVLPEVPDNVKFWIGWFDQTIPKYTGSHVEPIKLLHVDCTVFALFLLIPFFQQLLILGYYCHHQIPILLQKPF